MKALTDHEQRLLLEGTGTGRDYVLFALAMGTGLRLFELLSLNVGDIYDGKEVRSVVKLNPLFTKGKRGGIVVIPQRYHLMVGFLCCGRELDAPLFISRGGGRSHALAGSRLSHRGAQASFHMWQRKLGFERGCHFHMLRYTFCWNFWRALGGGGDLVAVQKAARHAEMKMTADYVMVAAGGFTDATLSVWRDL